MIEALTVGTLMGIFSGTIPGPFSALIAATALKNGFWAGFRIGIVPLATETVVMAITALTLSQLPSTILQWSGIAGGAFVLYLARETWKEADRAPEAEPLTGTTRQVLRGALLAVLSPTPWVFWLLVGGPLFLAAASQGWPTGLIFLGSFLFFLVGSYVGIAGLAAYGQKKLPKKWRTRMMRAASITLLVGGGILIWQSSVGNFHRMVRGSETIQSLVGGSGEEDETR